MAILAIDQGTSGTKAVVVDGTGEVLAVAERTVHPHYGEGGVVEQDPTELLESVLAAATEAIAAAGQPLDAVSFANQGETVLAWDPETGAPLTTAISWQDRRAQEICDELASHSELVHQRTGLQLDPYFTAPKMAWLRRHWTTEGVVTTTDTWVVHHLTGEFVTDVSTASRSLVFDLDRVSWDPELLEIFGLSDERLPRLVASDDIVGETEMFGGKVPVTGLIVDQQAALFAESCLTPGTAKCTFGTGAFLLVNTGETAPRFDNGLTTSVAWKLRGRTSYCADGQVYTAASAVRWLIDLGLIDSAEQLDTTAAEHSGGALCVPSFAGLAAPWWRADMGAVLTGVGLSTGRAEIVRAVLDGIAAQVAELADLVAGSSGGDGDASGDSAPAAAGGRGFSIERLRVDGGLTRSRVLMQAQADLMQVPIDVFASPHATALGAAACARLGLDPELDVADAPLAWHPSQSYTPQMERERSAEFRAAWRHALETNIPKERA